MTCKIKRSPIPRLTALLLLWALSLLLVDAEGRDFYKILGVSRNADSKEIKRRYRDLSKQYHPDNAEGGDADKFLDIRDAHEALTDEKLRKLYDRYGEEGLDPNFQPGGPRRSENSGGGSFVFRAGNGAHYVFRSGGFTGGGGGVFGGGSFAGFGENFFTGDGRRMGGGGRPQAPARDFFDEPGIAPIKKTRRTMWSQDLQNSEYACLVFYYSPGCAKCQAFKKDFIALNRGFDGLLTPLVVNCSEEPSLCGHGGYPQLKVVFPDKSELLFPQRLPLNQSSVRKWLTEQLPVRAVWLRTAEHFERWLTRSSETAAVPSPQPFAPAPTIPLSAPKVLYVAAAGRSSVPLTVRVVFEEYAGRLDAAVFYRTSPSAERVLQKLSPSLASKPLEGAGVLLHVTDIDTLDGEYFPVPAGPNRASSKTVLGLSLLRVLNAATSESAAPPTALTARRMKSGTCSASDSSVCLLLVTSGPPAVWEQRLMQTLAETYRTDRGLKFFWLDAYGENSRLAASFGYDTLDCQRAACEEEDSCSQGDCAPWLVAWRPKRRRFAVAEQPVTAKSAEAFVDGVLSGVMPLKAQ